MSKATEAWVTVSDGKKLYEKVWEPTTGTPAAHLVFLHGFSDHSNCYYNFFPTISSPPFNITVHALDQRGWGRSVTKPAEKGLTGGTPQVLQDVHDYVTHVWKSRSSDSSDGGTEPAAPLFLMGHSMGGQIALHYLLNTESPYNRIEQEQQSPSSSSSPIVSGLLLESPYIALHPSSQPSSLVVAVGKFASRLLPNRPMLQKLDATYMSKSAKVREEWVNDPLCHDTGTLKGLADMLERAAQLDLLSKGGTVPGLKKKLPSGCNGLWIGHGSGDHVTIIEASKRLIDVIEVDGAGTGTEENRKILKDYEGAYHKLHGEPDGVGEEFTRDVGEWIIGRVKMMGGEGGVGAGSGSGIAGESGQDAVKAKL